MRKIKAKEDDLHYAIIRSGRNQRQFANDITISHIHLNRIINGKVSPSGEMTKKICKELNKEFDDLFEFVPRKESDANGETI